MKCPVCSDTPLVMTERQGIEIDYCPQCRGVWLDRGELEKLMEGSRAVDIEARPAPQGKQLSVATPAGGDIGDSCTPRRRAARSAGLTPRGIRTHLGLNKAIYARTSPMTNIVTSPAVTFSLPNRLTCAALTMACSCL